MKFRAIHIRRFRSIEATSVTNTGGLNVFIGRNNSGKSSILETVDVALTHLRGGRLATAWRAARRVEDEFHKRDTSKPLQLGIEFEIDATVNASLRSELRKESPQFEKAIEQLATHEILSLILVASASHGRPFIAVQAIGLGPINTSGSDLSLGGVSILNLPLETARELAAIDSKAGSLRKDVAALEQLAAEPPEVPRGVSREPDYLRYVLRRTSSDISPELVTALRPLLADAESAADFARVVAQLAKETRDTADSEQRRDTINPIAAFAGEVHSPPAYATWIMEQVGATKILHFRESKKPIGPTEAAALLDLKVRRGGEERLRLVRQTVQSLLGVSVDAFEPESRMRSPRAERSAEMDIDDFLVEANGAGIREALRLILDIELQAPDLVLVEEPEVHLHPGLEHAMHGYLREKSQSLQVFLTTHSTNFVDTAALQNVYLVARDAARCTTCEPLLLDAMLDRVPSELGLRLSTVFMFDRLIFVEGKSDEDVLREFARILRIDLAASNVGFVQMGGVQNFAHFAADATLDLLSRRQVRMWFVLDRDERDDADVQNLLKRLGGRAELCVLERRELDNHLLVPRAIAALAREKSQVRQGGGKVVSDADAEKAISESTEALRPEVSRLRTERLLLRSVHLQGRGNTGPAADRLQAAITELTERLQRIATIEGEVQNDLDARWGTHARSLAPGSLIIDGALQALVGSRYSKVTDGPRLARLLEANEIDRVIVQLLKGATNAC